MTTADANGVTLGVEHFGAAAALLVPGPRRLEAQQRR
jgi:hypothetical protein